MNSISKCMAITLASGAFALTGTIVNAAEKDTVKYRENLMEVIGGHMGSIVAIVKGEVPYKSDLKLHADGMAAAATLVKPAFKTKAMTDKSHALPEIWTDWEAFAKSADQMEEASTKLASAVTGGDPATIGKAVAALGNTCKGCHDDFTDD